MTGDVELTRAPTRVGLRSTMRAAALPLVVYGAASVWFTWPLASVGVDHVITSSPVLLNDLYLVLWILTWVGRALTSAPLSLFDGNVLHPTPHVVAGSEHLIGDIPIFLPVWLATDNAILALNVLTLASFVCAALAMHFLAQRWTGSCTAGWVAGVAFAFAPWRGDLGRAHLLQVQYLPMIAYGVDRALATGSMRTAMLSAGLIALQVLCSYYLGFAAYVVVGSFVVVWLFACRGRPKATGAWRALAVVTAGPLLVVGPVSVPYLLARTQGGLAAVLTRSFATPWAEFGRPLNVLEAFVGWGTASIGAAALLSRVRAGGSRGSDVRLAFLVVALVLGVLLAAGPEGVLGGWVAPYTWLAAVVPGFSSLRVPARFGIVASFAASGIAAFGVADLDRRLAASGARRARVVLGVAAIALCTSWMAFSTLRLDAHRAPTRAQLSPAHQWLQQNGRGRPLLELPTDPVLRLADSQAMFASTYHWLPLVNGYTGYMPPGSSFLLEHAAQLPSMESLQILVDCADLEWILVHRASPGRDDPWRRFAGVRLVKTFPSGLEERREDDLYRVTTPRRGKCPGLFDRARTALGAPIPTVARPKGSLTAYLPAAVSPRRMLRIGLSLQNDDAVTWPATAVEARSRFAVWYSWRPVDGSTAKPWRRIVLPQDLAPGERLSFAAWIAPPGRPGGHVLALRAGQGDEPSAPLVWEQNVDVRAPEILRRLGHADP